MKVLQKPLWNTAFNNIYIRQRFYKNRPHWTPLIYKIVIAIYSKTVIWNWRGFGVVECNLFSSDALKEKWVLVYE